MALSTNLVNYWKFDESSGNATDSVGGNTGTNSNVTYQAGKLGNGALFDSTTDKFALASVPITGNNVFSVSCWAKTSATGANTLWYWGNTSSKASIFLTYEYNGGSPRFGIGAFAANYYVSYTMTTDVWYHLVVTYDQTNEYVYANGVLIATQALTTLNIGTNTARIGIDIGDNAGSRWQGMIDEMGIWSRVITADEVAQIFNSGRGNAYPLTDTPSLYGGVAYYKADTGALITDSIGVNTLTNTGTVAETATGKIGYGADFGATNSSKLLGISSNLGIDGTPITLSIWAKMQASDPGGGGFGLCWQASSNTKTSYRILWINDGTKKIYYDRSRYGVVASSVIHNNNLDTTTYHHFVLTYNGTNIVGYLDGSAVESPVAASGNGSVDPSSRFSFGAQMGGGSGNTWASAFIDEVFVCNRAISSTEVTSLYNSGNGFQWPFTPPPTVTTNYLHDRGRNREIFTGVSLG